MRGETLVESSMFGVYLEGTNEKSGAHSCIWRSRERTPPVCQELACSTISLIIPHYRLIVSSCLTHDHVRNGVRHCLHPQSYQMCCNQAVHPPTVFCFLCLHTPGRFYLAEMRVCDVIARIPCPRLPTASYCSRTIAKRKSYQQGAYYP